MIKRSTLPIFKRFFKVAKSYIFHYKHKKTYLEQCLNLEHRKIDKDITLIKSLEDTLKNIIYDEVAGAKIRSRLQWIEEGEKSTKFFHNLEKYNARNKSWTKILNNKNQIVDSTNEIINVQVDFYRKLHKLEL